jgi:hypothetical protein
MTKQHPVSELVERDNEPTTGNAQRIAAEITQALQDAGNSCAVLKATPGGPSGASQQSWCAYAPMDQKQTLRCVQPMSALLPKADIAEQSLDVRFVPEADIDLHSRSGRSRRTPIP